MNKKFLQQKLDDIYAREDFLVENKIRLVERNDWDTYFEEWKGLLDRATDLLEKCIREGVRDDD